jgi:adenosylhomocysteine nucleosidase
MFFASGDSKGAIHCQSLFPDLAKGICGTGDRFELGPAKLKCDLVDMEAYAIAKVCKKLDVKFSSFKYITDGSDDQAHKHWIENLKPAAKKLREIYDRIQSEYFL